MTEAGFPPQVRMDLKGWRQVWYRLLPREGSIGEDLWREAVTALEDRVGTGTLSGLPEVVSIRRLFRAAGCDPTRYRPSSEALARRLLKGQQLSGHHQLVDLNNLLSVRLMLPCCVIDAGAVQPPFVFRSGEEGEVMESMRGPFSLSGKPLLEDQIGPFGTPVTDSARVKIQDEPRDVWLVVYAFEGSEQRVEPVMTELLERTEVAVIRAGPAVL